jgi:hypothetical protein
MHLGRVKADQAVAAKSDNQSAVASQTARDAGQGAFLGVDPHARAADHRA